MSSHGMSLGSPKISELKGPKPVGCFESENIIRLQITMAPVFSALVIIWSDNIWNIGCKSVELAFGFVICLVLIVWRVNLNFNRLKLGVDFAIGLVARRRGIIVHAIKCVCETT